MDDDVPGGEPAHARRPVIAVAAVIGIGALAALLAGSWYGWSPAGESQLTLLGHSWARWARDPECVACDTGYRFNWAIAATVFAPFTSAAAFLVLGRRLASTTSDETGGAGAVLRRDITGWVLAGIVFVVVGFAFASDPGSWNRSWGDTSLVSDAGGISATFNWCWASAAAMFALLGAAIARGGRDVPPTTRRSRALLAVSCAVIGVAVAYVVARAAGSVGSNFGSGRVVGPDGGEMASRTNWLVFTPLAAGCVGAALVRVADLVGVPEETVARRRAIRRVGASAGAVAIGGTVVAVLLARRFRLSADRLFDWSGSSTRPDRFNWVLFGLVLGPALVVSAAVLLRAVPRGPRPRRWSSLIWIVVPVLGVVLAALLARRVGSDAERMSVLRNADDGRPRLNVFVLFAAAGPFLALAGAVAAATGPGRRARA